MAQRAIDRAKIKSGPAPSKYATRRGNIARMGVRDYRLLYHAMPMREALTFLMSAGIQAQVEERQRKIKKHIQRNLR